MHIHVNFSRQDKAPFPSQVQGTQLYTLQLYTNLHTLVDQKPAEI